MAYESEKSVLGRGRAYVDKDSNLVAKGGHVAGGFTSVGNVGGSVELPGNPSRVVEWDDFLGDLVSDRWAYVEGGDTGAEASGVVTTATNGVFRLTSMSQASHQNVRTNPVALTADTFKNWKLNQGKGGLAKGHVHFGARVRLQEVSRTVHRLHAFFGLNDTGGAETPVLDTGAGIVGQAADFIGFAHMPGGDTGWIGIARQGGGTPQTVVLGESPSDNEYDVLEFEFDRDNAGDTGGSVFFYVNGLLKGKISNPATQSVAMSPWLGFANQDTGARYVDVDWVNIAAPRDTGS